MTPGAIKWHETPTQKYGIFMQSFMCESTHNPAIVIIAQIYTPRLFN